MHSIRNLFEGSGLSRTFLERFSYWPFVNATWYLYSVEQVTVAWKCRAGTTQELDSRIVHRIRLNGDGVALAVCGLHRHIAEAFAHGRNSIVFAFYSPFSQHLHNVLYVIKYVHV